MRASSRSFQKIVSAYPPELQRLAADVRAFVQKQLPDVQETTDTAAAIVGYRYAPGYRGLVCTLILSKAGVKLGIVQGASFADPHRLLQGSGKVHRHIALRTAADLRRRGTRELLQAAAVACRARLA